MVDRWTEWIAAENGVSDTFDVRASGALYRVFLLPSTLQVDISFWPHEQFRATEEGFHVLFGTPNPSTTAASPDPDPIIGTGWLYAFHARSALARSRPWQAALMLDDLRAQILALACIRHGLNPWHGRDVDRLPTRELAALETTRAGDLDADALATSMRRSIELFLAEIERHDRSRARRLTGPLTALASNP